jgi:hypothetical protein
MTSLFDALRQVETGGHPDPTNAVGDGGKSHGPYQISLLYWLDAVEHDSNLGGSYADVRDESYARRVMAAYWDRYAPDNDFETLARIHNGGPNGHKNLEATQQYWEKVHATLEAIELRRDREGTGGDPSASAATP